MEPELSAPDVAWTVHTDVFDGPLDLLLHLVRRDGIDLRRLQVSRIADAYLATLDHLRGLNLSIAWEYLVMAATLVHLKSLDLLPRAPTPVDDEAPDPRADFARTLRDYQRVKDAAAHLAGRPWEGREQHGRPPARGADAALEAPVDAFGLLDLYRELLARAEPVERTLAFDEPGPDLGSAAMAVLTRLHAQGGHGELTDLLGRLPGRPARVVTFVCVLEMARLRWIELRQRAHLAAVDLVALVTPDRADLGALTGWVEVG